MKFPQHHPRPAPLLQGISLRLGLFIQTAFFAVLGTGLHSCFPVPLCQDLEKPCDIGHHFPGVFPGEVFSSALAPEIQGVLDDV
jgi:hypothetical protein